jgi:hypothetical protein
MAIENRRQFNIDSFWIHLILEGQYYFSFITVHIETCSIKFNKIPGHKTKDRMGYIFTL